MRFSKNLFRTISTVCAALLLAGCATTQPSSLHHSLQNPDAWSYGADPYGSKVMLGEQLIEDGAARIAFERAPRPAHHNTWIELIYYVPEGNLSGTQKVRITYQCSEDLLMKFSQSDFGEDGDESYAHYQALLPASAEWKTVTVSVKDFSRPSWTPATSADVGLKLENVNAIYLAPALDDATGGYATLNVRAIELLPVAKE